MYKILLGFIILLSGCVTTTDYDSMTILTPGNPELYSVATIQRMSDDKSPVHIYIEGDGYAFTNRGLPTDDPTPQSSFMRDMTMADQSPNVAYIARPCQFFMDDKCTPTNWTDGRFSRVMVDSVANAVKTIAGNRPVILIGYSGGAMISGLIIQNYDDIDVKQWITIAGVLNHADWTNYFGDAPLTLSLNMNTLPHVYQTHYVAKNDKTVPNSLSRKWVSQNKLITVPNATHNLIPIIKLDFKD